MKLKMRSYIHTYSVKKDHISIRAHKITRFKKNRADNLKKKVSVSGHHYITAAHPGHCYFEAFGSAALGLQVQVYLRRWMRECVSPRL